VSSWSLNRIIPRCTVYRT